MKNRRNSAEGAKVLHLLFVTCLFFEVKNRFKTLERTSTNLYQ